MAKRKKETPKNETKEQKFVRLAEKRTQKALQAISALGKLTGSSYAYTPAQAAKIVDVLTQQLGAVKEKFAGKKEVAVQFKL